MRRKKLLEKTVIPDSAPKDLRLQQLKAWLTSLDDVDLDSLRPASNDASFRRYFRVDYAAGTAIVMDAPPDKEDCGPFVSIANMLAHMGLTAPSILADNSAQGFLLLSDLGEQLYLPALTSQHADTLYADAMDALLVMRASGDRARKTLPRYDGPFLRSEMALFHDWLCGEFLGIQFDDTSELSWQILNDCLVNNALEQPNVFVHRDYHSRNLMVHADNPGIIDFQDAMNGPLTYDLVSLLKDCYVRWPRDRALTWARYFYDHAFLDVEWPVFLRWFDLMGVQRHLKAAGIFARLSLRDGKSGYLDDIPRTLAHILDLQDVYPELGWLCDSIEQQILPGMDTRQ